jgi:choice-of-anchor B domain-containing protein
VNGDRDDYRVIARAANGDSLDASVIFSGTPNVVSANMTLLGVWHERQNYGGLWGYTAPDGREYALLPVRDEGLSIIDLWTDPPTEVSFVPTLSPGRDAKEVRVKGRYAYVNKESEPMQIIDLADPSNPVVVNTLHVDPPAGNGGAHTLEIDGDFLYSFGNKGVGGVVIYDLTDPVNPVQRGSRQPYYFHDGAIRNDTLYACAIYGQGIDIIDVSDKDNPAPIANFNYAGSGAHNCELSADGRYLFVGDEIGSSGNWMRAFDVSNPFAVTQVGAWIVDSSAVVHNFFRVGDDLYVAHYTEGVRVVDISNPATPVEVAHYDTYQPAQYGFHSVWNVYPYFASGRIIASDLEEGLWVLHNDLQTGVVDSPSGPPGGPRIALHPNHPNPFRSSTTIAFDLGAEGDVWLRVFDVSGRVVRTLLDGKVPAGRHEVVWDGRNEGGDAVASGIYFYEARGQDGRERRRMLRIE